MQITFNCCLSCQAKALFIRQVNCLISSLLFLFANVIQSIERCLFFSLAHALDLLFGLFVDLWCGLNLFELLINQLSLDFAVFQLFDFKETMLIHEEVFQISARRVTFIPP